MKKIVLLALVMLLMFSMCSCGPDGEEIPFEECIQIAVGQWDDPLGKAPSLVLNEDKTAEYMGETFTWDVTWSDKPRKEDSDPNDAFFLELYDTEGTERFVLLFVCYYDEQVWKVIDVSQSGDGGSEYPYKDYYLFKDGNVDIVYVDESNFEQYFEFAQIFEWKDEQRTDWNYFLYLIVKPEYEEKMIETNWSSDLGVTVGYRNYNIFVDAENDIVEIGDVHDPYSETIEKYEKIEVWINKGDYKYTEGYLTPAYIFMPKDYSNGSYVALAEYCSIDFQGIHIVLKK